MIFPFLLFSSHKQNAENYSYSTHDWKPIIYEFQHLQLDWLYVLGICDYSFSSNFDNSCIKVLCDRLDNILDSFEYECEKEYHCNSRYLDKRWIYSFEDNVIDKLIDISLKNFKEKLFPFDEDFCNMIVPKVRKELFKIGRDYFSVQMENQIRELALERLSNWTKSASQIT